MWASVSEKIADLINYAITETEYYRCGYPLKSFDKYTTDYNEFIKLPLLTKHLLRDDYKRFLSRGIDEKNCKISYTSGSTGVPMKYVRSQKEYTEALFQISKERKVWSNDAFSGPIAFFEKIYEPLQYIYQNHQKQKLILSLYGQEEERLQLYIAAINEFKPKIIQGYASNLYQMARYILKNKIELNSISLVENRSEHLTENQRMTIEKAFNCRVSNFYGLAEVYPVAYECPNKKMHICTENVFIEIISPETQEIMESDYGEIIITALNSYTMPLIRYKTGDVGRITKQQCGCGDRRPILDLMQGRLSDAITTPYGELNSVLIRKLYREFHDNEGKIVTQMQIVQTGITKFVVKTIPIREPSKVIEKRIEQIMLDCFPYNVEVEVKWVDELMPHPNTGKVNVFINMIQNDISRG